MDQEKLRVLLLDDETSLREPLANYLRKSPGYEVDTASDGSEAIQLVEEAQGRYDVALIDEVLADGPTGVEVFNQIKSKYPEIEVIILTGQGMKSGEQALLAGAYGYHAKPFSPDELAVTIGFAAERGQARRERHILQGFQQVTAAINRTLDLNEILNKTCRAAVELLNVDHSGLVLFQPDLIQGEIFAEYPNQEIPGLTRTLGTIIPVRDSPAEEELIFDQRILNISDVANEIALGPVREILLKLGIQSILIVPVVSHGNVIASFSLDSMRELRTFTQNEIELCKSLANHVAIAIENARLLHEAREGREYLEALYHAGNAILSPDDPSEVLQKIVEMVCQATGAWRAVVLTIDRQHHKDLRVLAQTGFQAGIEPSAFVREDGISIKVITSQEPYFISNVAQAEHVSPNPHLLARGTQAAACLPLSLHRERTGVLWVEFLAPHTFSTNERKALQLYATQSAIAYDNARRIQELEQLQIAADAMATAAQPQEVLQQIVESARTVLGADYAVIWSYDAVRRIFFPEELAAANIPAAWLDKFRPEEPQSGKTTQYVLNEGYVAIEELASLQGTYLGEPTRALLNALDVESFQGIRLDIGGEPLGVLFVDYIKPRSFDSEDRRILENFANHAALTLKRARLLEQVVRAREEARAIAKVSTLGNLEATLRAIVEGARDALRCDVATLYIFNQDTGYFSQAIGVGLLDGRHMRPPEQVLKDSALWKIIGYQEPYYHVSEYVPEDKLLRGHFVQAEHVLSAFGIPLRYGERRVGVMFINYRTMHRFTDDEIQDALQFANQAAIAIRNAQLYSELEQRAEALAAVYDAGTAITGSLSLEETLERIAVQARRIVGLEAERCLTRIALLEGDKLRIVAGSSPAVFDLQTSAIIGIDGRAVKTGLTQQVNDVMQDPDYIMLDKNTRSELSVPLTIGGQVIGVLSVEHTAFNAFSSEGVRNLELLAAQAAVAIQNARQYEELKRTKGLVGSRTALAWMGMVSSTWRHSVEQSALTIRENVSLLRHDSNSIGGMAEFRQQLEHRLDRIEKLTLSILEKPITPPLSSEEGVEDIQVNDFVRERTKQLWVTEPHENIHLELTLNVTDDVTVRASRAWLRRAFDIVVDNAVKAVANQLQPKLAIGTNEFNGGTKILISDTGSGIPPEDLPKLFLTPVPSHGALGIGLLLAQTIAQAYGGDISVESTSQLGTTMSIWLPKEINEFTTYAQDATSKYVTAFDYERLYKEQTKAFEKLQELDRKKTEFLSSVSHELRTPLTPVKSCIENLLAEMYGPLTQKQKARLETALVSVSEETRLIQNLLDLARIQEGRVTLELEDGSVTKILRDVSTVFQYDADQKRIALVEGFPENDTLQTLLDVGKMKQVVTNILSNAFKFTPAGGLITIAASRHEGQIEVHVTDTGIGIPVAELRKIFERFYQVDSSLTRKVAGTGIGLSIAKEYVELHGGRIWVESTLGEGSTFHFTLPLRGEGD